MKNTDTFDGESLPDNGSTVHPRSWQCTKLTDVRRRLVDVVKRIETDDTTKRDKDRVAYYRLLVYAYQCLSTVVRDVQLDEIEARISVLEKEKENLHENNN
jgi:hypothetical protein